MEKRRVIQIQNQIKTLLAKDEVLKERTEINKNFTENFFLFPKWMTNQCALCKKDMTEEKVKHELNKREINKSPGNNRLTKEFYEWGHLKFLCFSHLKWLF